MVNYIIFCISVIGIICIIYLNNNMYILSKLGKRKNLEIILTIYNVDNVDKDRIISEILNGNLDNVDKIEIN